MLLVKSEEIRLRASTHSTRISLAWRDLEYDIAEWTVGKIWTRGGRWVTTKRLEFMNLDLRQATSMGEFMRSATVLVKEIWLDPTRVTEPGRGRWGAIIAQVEASGPGRKHECQSMLEPYPPP